MSHKYDLELTRPLRRRYNQIGVNVGEDVTIVVPIKHDEWINKGYSLTIYDESDGTTLASVGISSEEQEITIDDFSFNTTKALVTVEDRSDINNIEAVETIGYIIFQTFKRGSVAATQEGFITYTNADDSTTSIPYYGTNFSV